MLAVIGGSGLSQFSGLDQSHSIEVRTPYGEPSGPLTLGEFRVTERLARAHGDVSYRQLYDVLKGESFIAGSGSEGYRANVRTLVKRIRQKFCDVDGQFSAIVSVPGFGYRWREGAPDGQA